MVDGSTSIGGGGSFRISQGSTLQFVTSGEFHLGSGIVTESERTAQEVAGIVVPTLSILSTFPDRDHNKAGVRLDGHSAFHGQVVAPFSEVSVGGSGSLHGALNARKIDISGSGGFHYDESFSDMSPLDGGGELSAPRLISITSS